MKLFNTSSAGFPENSRLCCFYFHLPRGDKCVLQIHYFWISTLEVAEEDECIFLL